MEVKCIREYKNKKVIVGEVYTIIDDDMGEYLIEIDNSCSVWISKDDIEHFKYYV